MKLLIATFTYPPNKDGIAEASAVLADGFRDAGWEVEVATTPTEPARREMTAEGVRIHEFAIRGP
ncbi:MAG: hypothetical protein KDN05_23890, partial [Verrucomicrobiae bacterium]|nr:hypothetical protein [Verrucomicrobiae bacterium]